MKIEEFLAKCEAAADVPVVYSKPLIELQMALVAMEAELEDVEDETLNPVIDAAQEVAYNWGFYPTDQYGSHLATIDPDMVVRLGEALAAMRKRLEKAIEDD
jgi:hypothetical protein